MRPPHFILFFLLLALAGRAPGVTVGVEPFTYANGAIANRAGGTGFHYDFYDNEVTTFTSDWDAVTGSPTVNNSNALVTNNTAAKREYNGTVEGTGDASNDGQNNHERSGAVRGYGRIFYRFDMTRSASATWSGASSYDFSSERVFFGVPAAVNPASGLREYGCSITGGGETFYSGIAATGTAKHTLVAVLDFDRDFIGLWVDPDAADFYNGLTGANSADAGGTYTGDNWSSAICLGSGGQVVWDNLTIATKWKELGYTDPLDSDGDGMSNVWETAHGLNPNVEDADGDADNDGVSNGQEFIRDLDPQDSDTDNDGFSDGAEAAAGTDPHHPGSYPGAVLPQEMVGGDRFTYSDGPIAGRAGGIHWDVDNTTEDDEFTGHEGVPSDWDAASGNPQVSGGKLVTLNGSAARREYKGPGEGAEPGSDERAGAVNEEPNFAAHVIYYKFEMKRSAGATWSGAAAMDFGAERYSFGVPDAVNPASGKREFAIHDLDNDQRAYSGIEAVNGQTYTLVAKLDYDADIAALYLNPDLTKAESQLTPVATYPHTSDNWSTEIRLGSGGTGEVEWDNLRVAHAWEGLDDGPPQANDDSATLAHGAKVRLKVLANDGGVLAPSSVTVVTPPTKGTATVNADGSILYQHTTGTPATDSFIYRVANADQAATDTATVTLNFSSAARFNTDYVSMPAQPPAGALEVEDAFPGITFNSPHGFCGVKGDAHKLFIAEGDGRVFIIPDVEAPVPQKIQILDIVPEVAHDHNEIAMKGVAAHPQWAQNGYLYVTYHTNDGTVRLSRFTCQTTAPYAAGSELILLEQGYDGGIHGIGSCEFGPDGYLYVSFGDEGTQEDAYNNAQHVDRNLWSCIIRIDVDKKPGSLAPARNPGPDPYAGPDPAGQSNDADLVIPRIGGGNSGEAYFAIPPDNPLIGRTTFNGITLDPGQLRTEIFAMGLRNPWQFSAEDTDGNGSVDQLWVGDVGRSDIEELSVLSPGGNGGWSWHEGSGPGYRAGGLLNGAPESAATLTGPLWEYPHGGGPYQGSAIIGGFIYHGTAMPSLAGKYIFADYAAGNIWSLDRSGPQPVVERIGGEVAIVGLLPDPASGDILLLDRGNTGENSGIGGIKRLRLGANDTGFPATLSATNFFADLTDLTPNPGAHGYEPQLRFWSDRAEKKRWFLIKNATDTMGYSPEDPWTFPQGMLWVKHFDYPVQWESFTRVIEGQNVSDRRPVAGSPWRRLETRFLIKNAQGSYGVSYRWNHTNSGTQTDATLADDDGESFNVDITLDGAPSTALWQIPSRTNCITCHTPQSGHALSFRTRQLNGPGTLDGASGNFISLLGSAGYLTNPPANPAALPRLYRPDETAQSLEVRVRSYLDANCSNCHRVGGTGGGTWDARASVTLAQAGLIYGSTTDTPLHAGDRLIVPGKVAQSIIYNRIAAAHDYSRMPPIGGSVIDLEGAALMSDWIQSLQPYASYPDWRMAKFGNVSSANGAPTANPDGDALDNLGEWAFGTNPLLSDDTKAATAVQLAIPATNTFRFSHHRLQARATAGLNYSYRLSQDLTNWSPATVTEESVVPLPTEPGYEMVTLSIAPAQISGKPKLFVQVVAGM